MAKPYPERTPEAIAERREQILFASRMGRTVKEIAAAVGVSPFTVKAVRKSAGLSKPRAPRYTVEEDRIARALLEDGASYHEVARTLNRSRQALARRFPGYGWTMQERDDFMAAVRQFQPNGSRSTIQQTLTPRRADHPSLAAPASPDRIQPIPAAPSDVLRVLNRGRNTCADRVVSYCESCGKNDRSPVLGVFAAWEEAEAWSANHRIRTRQLRDAHDPYEYDLFELPEFADPDDVLAVMSEHIPGWRAALSTIERSGGDA